VALGKGRTLQVSVFPAPLSPDITIDIFEVNLGGARKCVSKEGEGGREGQHSSGCINRKSGSTCEARAKITTCSNEENEEEKYPPPPPISESRK
jgi:hypothetical protein